MDNGKLSFDNVNWKTNIEQWKRPHWMMKTNVWQLKTNIGQLITDIGHYITSIVDGKLSLDIEEEENIR